MGEITTKLLVLGGGPGGYVAGIRAGQHGIDTVLVEENRLGGTCLNVGCIPSKAMIHAAEAFHAAVLQAGDASPFGLSAGPPTLDFARTIAWKDGIVGRLNTGVASLLKRGGVKILRGRGRMVDGKTCLVETDTGPERVRAEHVILSPGSVPAALPHLPFGGRVISSTEALSLPRVPATMAVVGAGYIGLELGTAFAKLGAKVTVVEMAERILPAYDAELTRPVARRLGALGIDVLLGAKATGLSASGDALDVDVGGELRNIPAEVILVAVGRKARTHDLGLDRLDLDMSGPFIRIDERCATSMRNVWAVGDVTGEPMLAHRAMAQGEMVADLVAGRRRAFHKVAIPAVCFTDPEVVSAGLSPDDARTAGHEIRTALFPFAANGRAMTLGAEDGFVRVTARADNHLLLGIQAVGAGVSELAAGFGLALEMGARLEDIAGTIHAHPTLGEAFHEANLRALGEALHI
ncbi:dihydrolipoyl dehydrogenase [Methylobacterium frigidaeris]|uniref:Dihydrolipoyl dehydrogenase n=1 Tax=Methylobacterium frigidaeris TaxID=2038277 RepID=A0AA37M6B6_9HYPH|nr:dihydrolipoyl dehydrogenase [Methylobacterium frigidaeris]PIK69641.1 dihydrolipoyl dehydrogenase [Methylobacterium frigidaeris]GJD64568.1 Dihydrolipoyl dehydrogenase [Methylobacterium frigidaeris]